VGGRGEEGWRRLVGGRGGTAGEDDLLETLSLFLWGDLPGWPVSTAGEQDLSALLVLMLLKAGACHDPVAGEVGGKGARLFVILGVLGVE
jgi:hypothetical protein